MAERSPTAGYSGTPLPRKLGIKPEHRVALMDAPDDIEETLGQLPDGVTLQRGLRGRGDLDVIVLFAEREAALRRRLGAAMARLAVDGGLWIAWRKESAARPGDLPGSAVRAIGLGSGLVDNKVCAIDESWSGLRFVVRVEDRPAWRGGRS